MGRQERTAFTALYFSHGVSNNHESDADDKTSHADLYKCISDPVTNLVGDLGGQSVQGFVADFLHFW